MARQFARLRPGNAPESADFSVVPPNGMCINVFLVFRSPDQPDHVLLGKLEPSAPWRELAALGPDRVARFVNQWLLPASQLLLFESPDDAARRVAQEQLEMTLTNLPLPHVFSEAYSRPDTEGTGPHWDLQFIYDLPWPKARPLRAFPWKELAFRPVGATPRSAFGRNHGDVLELIGLAPA